DPRIFPWLIPDEIITGRRAASPPLQAEQHGSDKRVQRCLPEFIIPADDLNAIFKIKMPVRKFSEISDIEFCNDHPISPFLSHFRILPIRASTPSHSAWYSTLSSRHSRNCPIYFPRIESLCSA